MMEQVFILRIAMGYFLGKEVEEIQAEEK